MDKKVKQYFDKLQSPQIEIMKEIRKLIQKSAPQAKERLSYGVPAFILNGGPILYAAFKNHIGFYPEPATIEAFANELKDYETAKGTIKFPLDQQIPYGLIGKIVSYKDKPKT